MNPALMTGDYMSSVRDAELYMLTVLVDIIEKKSKEIKNANSRHKQKSMFFKAPYFKHLLNIT